MDERALNRGPLSGVRITEFTSAWAGPYATCLLGFLGAEVIKVESRRRVDHARMLAFSTGKVFSGPNESPVFDNLNLNKRSVTLNLSQPRAVEIAGRMAGLSDVVVENMRPGVVPRLGLGYEVLSGIKPDLIYLSSSSCGQVGPEREYVGYAPTFAAMAGLSYITGYEDWPPSNFMGAIDLRSANTSAFAVLAALIYRQRTGKGQYIDLASQESVAVLIGDQLIEYIMNGLVPTRHGNQDDLMSPHDCYPCQGQDRWISIAVADHEEWRALCGVLGRADLADDPRFAEAQGRRAHREELDDIIGGWTRNRTDREAMAALQAAGVAAAPSMSSEDLYKDPHLAARQAMIQVDHPIIGQDWVVNVPWRLSETPAGIRRHSPLLGEDNAYVFQGLLGMTPEEIQTLEEEQVIF